MNKEDLKRAAANAALQEVLPKLGLDSIIGIGSGSTANCFIDLLAEHRGVFDVAVASSDASAARLRQHGISVIDLNAASSITVYVDGADEVDPQRRLIKGGGGALTREKICAASADQFICIVDQTKLVDTLGAFPLPVEVLPMARGLVARAIVAAGGSPVLREDFVTDNGNLILDVHGLTLTDPARMETDLNNIVGTVCNGIFAAQAADRVIVANPAGIQILA
jgi:ribose 5-phosphate isomerase A